jgi:hypothetical protein
MEVALYLPKVLFLCIAYGLFFCFLTSYNQAQVFVPELFSSLPKKLRNFIPEQLGSIKKSDLGL